MTLFLVLLLVLFNSTAWAMDLGVAGGISGAGQGLSQSMSQMQTFAAQAFLQAERERMDREREERAYQAQIERDERAYQHQLKMQQLQQQQRARPTPQAVASQPTTMQIETAKLDKLRPGWRQIVGPQPTKEYPELSPYRAWLAKQPKAYQRRLDQSVNAEEINESIGEFLEAH